MVNQCVSCVLPPGPSWRPGRLWAWARAWAREALGWPPGWVRALLLQPEPSRGDSQAPPAGPPTALSYRTASGPTGATWGLLAAAGPPHLQGRLATPWCCRGDPSAPEPVLGLHLPLERENFTQWGPPGCSVTGMCSCLSSCFPGEAQAQRGPAGHPRGQPRASRARARPPAAENAAPVARTGGAASHSPSPDGAWPARFKVLGGGRRQEGRRRPGVPLTRRAAAGQSSTAISSARTLPGCRSQLWGRWWLGNEPLAGTLLLPQQNRVPLAGRRGRGGRRGLAVAPRVSCSRRSRGPCVVWSRWRPRGDGGTGWLHL